MNNEQEEKFLKSYILWDKEDLEGEIKRYSARIQEDLEEYNLLQKLYRSK